MLSLQETVGSPESWLVLKIKERGQKIACWSVGGLFFFAAEKRGASVDVLVGACDGGIAFP